MKTIAEIAAEIGVTKQAVHKKIKQEPLSTSLRKFTTTKGNTLMIEVDGVNLIKQAFNRDKSSTSTTEKVDDSPTTSTNLVDDFIGSLQAQIETLIEQNKDLRVQLNQEREHSRSQADQITVLAQDMAKLAQNAQQLHAGDIMIPQLTNGTENTESTVEKPHEQQPYQKQGIFQRLFGK